MSNLHYDYFKSRFEAEYAVQQNFYQKTSFLLLTAVPVASFALYFAIDWKNLEWAIIEILGISKTITSLGGCVTFALFSWYLFRMVTDCAMQPMPDSEMLWERKKQYDAYEKEIEEYEKNHLDNTAQTDENEHQDNAATFEDYLTSELAHCASVNKKTNRRRSHYFYLAQVNLMISFAFFVACAILKLL